MKKVGLAIPLTVLGAVLFSAIAFVIPFYRGINFWIGYGFGLFAILFLGMIAYMSSSSEMPLQSRFYGWQLIGVAGIYTLTQMVVSLLLFSIPVLPIWLGVAICSMLRAQPLPVRLSIFTLHSSFPKSVKGAKISDVDSPP